MAIIYRIDIEDTTGTTVASIKNPISFTCNIVIGGKGDHQLVLSGFDPVINLIQDDYIVRFWRKDTSAILPNGQPSDFVNIFNGIHKTFNKSFTQSGNKTFTSYGSNGIELLDKAFVLYSPNSSQASKSLPASTAMIEFVRENIGNLATVGNGRKTDGQNPIIIIGSSGQGATWSDNVANKNLLTVVQNIRDFTRQQGNQIDFEVIYDGNFTWIFRCGESIYTDRSNVGLNPATGRNANGNVPIVFSPLYNNVLNFFESKSRYNEANTVLVVGSGVGSLQETTVRRNNLSVNLSPIAQRETIVNSNNSSLTQLDFVGDSALYELTAKTKINFEPKLEDVKLWNDFFPGDIVTAKAENNTEYQLQLTKVSINVSQSGSGSTIENLNLDFEDYEL